MIQKIRIALLALMVLALGGHLALGLWQRSPSPPPQVFAKTQLVCPGFGVMQYTIDGDAVTMTTANGSKIHVPRSMCVVEEVTQADLDAMNKSAPSPQPDTFSHTDPTASTAK